MDTNNEILDAIEILADKKIGENITKVLTGICTSVNINKNTCVMNSNGVSSTVQFYGSPPEVNELYRIFVPSNNMSRSFIVVLPRFTVNPNLLDNWYFANPVNQRGQTEYTGEWIYTIDRWQTSENSTLTVNNGSVSLTGSYIFEPLEEIVDALKGKTVTVSLLFSTGELEFATGVVPTTWSGWSSIVKNSHVGLQGIGEDSSRLWLLITDSAKNILAAKLELGPTQTLAHQDSAGNWVLNEVPEYGEQLRRCQRYFRRISPPQYAGFARGCAYNANSVRVMIPFETMRTSPSLNLNNATGIFASNSGIGDVFSLTFSGVWSTTESVTFDVSKTGAFVDGKEYILRGDSGGYIDISADL